MRTFAIIATLLGASPVLACPTASDLATGIQIFEDDGTTHVFRTTGPDTVSLKSTFSDGYGALMTLDRGAYVREIVDTDGGFPVAGTLTTYDYRGAKAGPPPLPVAGATWDSPVEVTSDGDSEFESQRIVWEAAGELKLGDCAYEVLTGKITYFTPDGKLQEELTYFTTLGISTLTAWYDPNEGLERYNLVWIEAIK